MNTSRIRLPLAMAVVTGLAAGCGGGAASGENADSKPTTPANTTTAAGSSSEGGKASSGSARLSKAVRAVQTAVAKVPHGRAYDLEDERYQGRQVWDIKVASGKQRPYELSVSADGGKVLHRSRHKRDDDTTKALQAKVSMDDALRTAGKKAGGRFSEAEIDNSGSKVVWSATFKQSGGAEAEVIMDAKSGKVIRTKHDH